MKQNNVILIVIAIFLTSFCLVSAFGVGSPYTRDDPMPIYQGETKTISLSLQNVDSENGLILKGELGVPSGISASLDKGTYNLGYQETGVNAILTVKVPSDAKIGDKYSIDASFKQQNVEEGGGMIALGMEVTRVIGVVVVERPPEPVPETPALQETPWGWIIGIIVVIIIIALIIYLVLRKKNQ